MHKSFGRNLCNERGSRTVKRCTNDIWKLVMKINCAFVKLQVIKRFSGQSLGKAKI